MKTAQEFFIEHFGNGGFTWFVHYEQTDKLWDAWGTIHTDVFDWSN